MKRFLIAFIMAIIARSSAATADDGVQVFVERFSVQFSKSEVDFFYLARAEKGRFAESVWIYWMNGNALLFVDLPAKWLREYEAWGFKSQIRLSSDVVATAADIQGSNYLVESDRADRLLRDCLLGGRKIVVVRKGPNQALEPTTMAVTPRAPSPTSK